MDKLRYLLAYILETLLRLFPVRAQTGLLRMGNPTQHSPVFVTCNYHLTVLQVKKALQNIDAFLLVANSRGVNVWCAAAGGLFSEHEVISVLKTSGIDNLVEHRRLILPQLAAAGVQAKIVQIKTGWKITWGPAYAADIPRFLERNLKKTPEMRTVHFPCAQRLEMAVAWAFPISILPSLVLLPFRPDLILPLILLVWWPALALFLLFPFYSPLLIRGRQREKSSGITFERGGLQFLVLGLTAAIIVICALLLGAFSWSLVFGWSAVAGIVVLLLTLDLAGSTPVYKSGLHEERFFRIKCDEEKCRGVAVCEDVCPKNCYAIDRGRRVAKIPKARACVQCGACIVQCPLSALFFESPTGEKIDPEMIRTFKLNLMGSRAVKNTESTKLPADERKRV